MLELYIDYFSDKFSSSLANILFSASRLRGVKTSTEKACGNSREYSEFYTPAQNINNTTNNHNCHY